MLSRTSVKTPKNQKGVALLVMIVVIILVFSSYIISGLSINQVKTEQNKQTRIALKKSKKALLAYAITHGDRVNEEGEMGFLPCPDVNNIVTTVEGNQDLGCSGRYINSIGYFPWKSLDLSLLADDSGTCLMYAVSGAYKLNTVPYMLNEDTNGMFQVVNAAGTILEGAAAQDRVVAIVFAPGVSLTGQTRTFDNTSLCGRNYEIGGVEVSDYVAEYLEGDGATDNGVLVGGVDTIDAFIQATSTSDTEATPYNDQFITITRDEIWEAILARSDFEAKMKNLTEALAQCLSSYATANAGNRLPWVAPMSIADYRFNANYDDSDGTVGYAGHYPFKVDTSNTKIGVAGVDELFTDAGCNNLAVGSGASAVTANLLDPSDPGPPSVPATEYRKLWNNWKDHFFYVVSKDYEPVDTIVDPDDEAAVVAANAAANAAAAAASAANEIAVSANIIKDAAGAASAALASGDTAAASTFATDAVSEATNIAVKEVTATAAAATADTAAVDATTAAAVAGVDPDVATATGDAANATIDASNAATDAVAAAGDADQAATKIEFFISLGNTIMAANWATQAAAAATDADSAAATADAAALTATTAATNAAAAASTLASCTGNCIAVNGTERAGVVIFSGSRQAAQLRTGPVGADANTKHLINNYLENGNEAIFPDNSGNDPDYVTGGNDIMFCIETDMSVAECL